jgi:uncharacterized protein
MFFALEQPWGTCLFLLNLRFAVICAAMRLAPPAILAADRKAACFTNAAAYTDSRGSCKASRGMPQALVQQEGNNFMILPVTLTAAGVAALLNIWLAVRVGQVRTSQKVSVGDGGNDAVMRRMRAHSNFTEFTPIVLILIAAIEYATGTSSWLWAVMAIYSLARIAHAFGMENDSKARGIGILVTMLTTLGLGLYAIAIPHLSAGQVESAPVEAVEAG